MGNPSSLALTGRAGTTTVRGSPFRNEELPGVWIIPTIHPAATLRGKPLDTYYIRADFNKARIMSKDGFKAPERELVLAYDIESAIGELDELFDHSFMAMDIETPRARPEVLAISFATSPWRSVSIPLTGRSKSETAAGGT